MNSFSSASSKSRKSIRPLCVDGHAHLSHSLTSLHPALLLSKVRDLSVGSGEEAKQSAVIWISHLIIYITLSTCLEPDESSYDTLQTLFERIVERKRVSFKMNVIQPLYFTSLKFHDSTLRHHAISLFKMSGQEGVWDGEMLGMVAKYVAEHEESQGCVELGSSKFGHQNMVIHEPARVHGVALDVLDRTSGKVHIEYRKRSFTSGKNIKAANSTSDCNGYESVWENKLLEP